MSEEGRERNLASEQQETRRAARAEKSRVEQILATAQAVLAAGGSIADCETQLMEAGAAAMSSSEAAIVMAFLQESINAQRAQQLLNAAQTQPDVNQLAPAVQALGGDINEVTTLLQASADYNKSKAESKIEAAITAPVKNEGTVTPSENVNKEKATADLLKKLDLEPKTAGMSKA